MLKIEKIDIRDKEVTFRCHNCGHRIVIPYIKQTSIFPDSRKMHPLPTSCPVCNYESIIDNSNINEVLDVYNNCYWNNKKIKEHK